MERPANWVPLTSFSEQFEANLSVLGGRDRLLAGRLAALKPTDVYYLAGGGGQISLGKAAGDQPVAGSAIEPLPNPLPPNLAKAAAGKMYPNGRYNQPAMVAGLDQGWLWEALYKLDASVAAAPGMKLPLYLLAADIERLWVVLHYQNWTTLLADPRVQLLAGLDAIARLQVMLDSNSRLIAPRLSVTVEPALWSAGRTYDDFIRAVSASYDARLAIAKDTLAKLDNFEPAAMSEKFRTDRLRILGITSRFTTFLQYSMRDWLAALTAMGHETQLLIEEADHESVTPLVFAEQCARFKPDLVLMIDHARGEFCGLPRQIPFVMWIQDRLPNIYRPQAGAMQKERDFVIGYGMAECVTRFGYPDSRFMPALVGVNEARFVSRQLTKEELHRYRCDVSFVSHASATAQQIVQEEASRSNSPQTRKLLQDLLGRLEEIYDGGACITEPAHLQKVIDQTLGDNQVTCEGGALLDMVMHRLNNALFRHQVIGWLADAGVDLHLYGKGWEKHPRFARFARGVADNQAQLCTIYQASTINLHASPFGSAHQRVFEGLAAGGFFLFRGVCGDATERVFQQAWDWCQARSIRSAGQMAEQADESLAAILSAVRSATGSDPQADMPFFFATLKEAALGGFCPTASTLWNEFDRVAFWNKDQLAQMVKHFLASADERKEIAGAMRQRALQSVSYSAISKRLLNFIAEDMGRSASSAPQPQLEAAAA
jgi:hypothetical protein